MRDGVPEIKMKQVELNNRIVIVIQRTNCQNSILSGNTGFHGVYSRRSSLLSQCAD